MSKIIKFDVVSLHGSKVLKSYEKKSSAYQYANRSKIPCFVRIRDGEVLRYYF